MDEDNDQPTCPVDGSDHSKPFVGMLFDSIEEAWEVWKTYGKKAGFGVRKDSIHKRKKDDTISDAKFVCHKEGHKSFDKRRVNSEHRWETRTGCLAKLYVVHDMECGKYMVKKFVDTHNHELETPDTIHMLRSHRSVTKAQGCAISVAADAGLTPSEAYALQVVEAGGRQNVGYVLEDHKTYLRTRRHPSIIYCNCNELDCDYCLLFNQWLNLLSQLIMVSYEILDLDSQFPT